MKIRFLIIASVIFLSSMLVSVASAAPYNQYQDPIKEQRIAAYTWLYGEALGGNKIAKRNLKVLEQIYGPTLTDLSKRAAREWQRKLIVGYLNVKYGPEGAYSELSTVPAIYDPLGDELRPDFRPVAREQGGDMRGSPASASASASADSDSGNASLISRAKEYVSGLYGQAKNLTGYVLTLPVTGPESSSSKVVTAAADIEKWMEKSGVVSPTVEYSITSFGLTQQPMTQLVSAWALGNSEKAEPLVRGPGTSARIAGRYP